MLPPRFTNRSENSCLWLGRDRQHNCSGSSSDVRRIGAATGLVPRRPNTSCVAAIGIYVDGMTYVSGFSGSGGLRRDTYVASRLRHSASVLHPLALRRERVGVQVELSVIGGYEALPTTSSWGRQRSRAAQPQAQRLFGARAAVAFDRTVSLELEGVAIPTGDTIRDYRLLIVGSRAQVLSHILDGRLRPFVLAGVGACRSSTPSAPSTTSQEGHRLRVSGGDRPEIRDHALFGLRFDARAVGAPNTKTTVLGRLRADGRHLVHARRHQAAAPPPPPPPPVAVKDSDGDGMPDDVDKCRTIPRTRTASRTTTAAPIPTTTRTASRLDRQVPERAGDQERYRRRGRLPREGRGRRRHPGSSDKCPNEAEDKDGFEDKDGARIWTTTRTGSPTRTTSARTNRRPRTATWTRMAAPTRCRPRSPSHRRHQASRSARARRR